MSLIKSKPTSPGRRFRVKIKDFIDIGNVLKTANAQIASTKSLIEAVNGTVKEHVDIVSVLSINTNRGQDLDGVADIVTLSDADIIGLQECDRKCIKYQNSTCF